MIVDVPQGHEELLCVDAHSRQRQAPVLAVLVHQLAQVHPHGLHRETEMVAELEGVQETDHMLFVVGIGARQDAQDVALLATGTQHRLIVAHHLERHIGLVLHKVAGTGRAQRLVPRHRGRVRLLVLLRLRFGGRHTLTAGLCAGHTLQIGRGCRNLCCPRSRLLERKGRRLLATLLRHDGHPQVATQVHLAEDSPTKGLDHLVAAVHRLTDAVAVVAIRVVKVVDVHSGGLLQLERGLLGRLGVKICAEHVVLGVDVRLGLGARASAPTPSHSWLLADRRRDSRGSRSRGSRSRGRGVDRRVARGTGSEHVHIVVFL
mmetsp:Transcript_41794/g.105391  ORF Transcript_41794/g.105391 Transcript_41794/m.105391 type:complete len:318 (+) Transcript_41794:620-1573(+)